MKNNINNISLVRGGYAGICFGDGGDGGALVFEILNRTLSHGRDTVEKINSHIIIIFVLFICSHVLLFQLHVHALTMCQRTFILL